jgi:hypothetical protein
MNINKIKEEPKTKKSAGQSGEDGNNQLRNRAIKIHLSPSEIEEAYEFYKKSGQKTFAGFCREKILSDQKTIKSRKDTIAETAQVLYQISKIGNNINQIARKINSLKSDYPELIEELKLSLEEIKSISKRVKK